MWKMEIRLVNTLAQPGATKATPNWSYQTREERETIRSLICVSV